MERNSESDFRGDSPLRGSPESTKACVTMTRGHCVMYDDLFSLVSRSFSLSPFSLLLLDLNIFVSSYPESHILTVNGLSIITGWLYTFQLCQHKLQIFIYLQWLPIIYPS
jgi:hypothetical protein